MRAVALLLSLLLLLPSCTLVTAAWEGLFGGDDQTEVRAEKETDMAVLHELVHRNGKFRPELVLEPNDVEPLEKVPETEPSSGSGPPAAPAGETTDDQRAVANAHNPPTTDVTPAPVQHAGALDFAFELGVIALLASLIAGVIVFAVRRPAVLALILSLLALVLSVMALSG